MTITNPTTNLDKYDSPFYRPAARNADYYIEQGELDWFSNVKELSPFTRKWRAFKWKHLKHFKGFDRRGSIIVSNGPVTCTEQKAIKVLAKDPAIIALKESSRTTTDEAFFNAVQILKKPPELLTLKLPRDREFNRVQVKALQKTLNKVLIGILQDKTLVVNKNTIEPISV